jgi:hypothetical protein
MRRGFPRPRFTIRVKATTIAPIRFMTIDLGPAFPAVEAGHRQQTDEEADEHRGGVVQDELLVAGAGGRGHDRGSTTARRLVNGVRDGYFLACSKYGLVPEAWSVTSTTWSISETAWVIATSMPWLRVTVAMPQP